MHPKEFKKVKNGTGHLTHLALDNSELFVGVDFSNHQKINEIIKEYDSYVMYPSKDALNISQTNPKNKRDMAIFIIDSTWSCSVKMLRESKNLQSLRYMSFDSIKLSQFKIKQQPAEFCLSTIESTLSVLELLNIHKIENIANGDLEEFLNPFEQMIEYQQKIIANPLSNAVRFKPKKER
ncbi:protein containing DTW domain [Sulfurimonas gotlandica GD1]|uniref:tRNA-uridine aminocarboxypropyltransferase n=2 Tax=Sulfurimonas TaxID=202746 RepID=B6BNB9_SULGG|nr:DTW domain protein [Sulfurimonas gotlandica GD1]EHP30989.1 protein containing DTW domain [Sulfurimonas gotlandica GD1]